MHKITPMQWRDALHSAPFHHEMRRAQIGEPPPSATYWKHGELYFWTGKWAFDAVTYELGGVFRKPKRFGDKVGGIAGVLSEIKDKLQATRVIVRAFQPVAFAVWMKHGFKTCTTQTFDPYLAPRDWRSTYGTPNLYVMEHRYA